MSKSSWTPARTRLQGTITCCQRAAGTMQALAEKAGPGAEEDTQGIKVMQQVQGQSPEPQVCPQSTAGSSHSTRATARCAREQSYGQMCQELELWPDVPGSRAMARCARHQSCGQMCHCPAKLPRASLSHLPLARLLPA